jgi:hypothetical protein
MSITKKMRLFNDLRKTIVSYVYLKFNIVEVGAKQGGDSHNTPCSAKENTWFPATMR